MNVAHIRLRDTYSGRTFSSAQAGSQANAYQSDPLDLATRIREKEAELRRCEELENEVDQIRWRLGHRKQSLRRYLWTHKPRPTPIRSIPVEMLQEIFRHTLGSECITIGDRLEIPHRALSQVCSAWRKIVHAYPLLWTRIRLSFYLLEPELFRASELWLEAALSRSSSSLLDITIASSDYIQDHWQELSKLFHLILPTSLRWQRLELVANVCNNVNNSKLFQALKPITGNLPELRCLDIKFYGFELVDPVELFNNTPKLRSLFVHDMVAEPNLLVPWCQLGTLLLQWNENPQTLVQCTQLNNLSLCFFESRNTSPSLTGITLSITEFSLMFSESFTVEASFLDHLVLPNMQKLAVSALPDAGCRYKKVFELAQPLKSLLSRSKCNITHLEWRSLPTLTVDFSHLLLCLPSLIELHFEEDDTWGTEFDKHKGSADGHWQLKYLTALSLCHILDQNRWLQFKGISAYHSRSDHALLPNLRYLSVKSHNLFDDAWVGGFPFGESHVPLFAKVLYSRAEEYGAEEAFERHLKSARLEVKHSLLAQDMQKLFSQLLMDDEEFELTVVDENGPVALMTQTESLLSRTTIPFFDYPFKFFS